MPVIPSRVLEKLYVKGSLRVEEGGFVFDLKNLIAPATITGINALYVDGEDIDGSQVTVMPPNGRSRPIGDVAAGRPLQFPIGVVVTVRVSDEALEPGHHDLVIRVAVKEIGTLDIPVSDTIA